MFYIIDFGFVNIFLDAEKILTSFDEELIINL